MWFLVVSWLFAPFLFNPSGFEWQKIVDDWDDWTKWISSRGGIGVPATKSWESWWDEEQEHLQYTGWLGRFWEVILALWFFVYQYGIVYHLHVSQGSKSIIIYGLSWLVIVAVMIILKSLSVSSSHSSASPWETSIPQLTRLHADWMDIASADSTSVEAIGEGSGDVGISESTPERVRLLDRACDLHSPGSPCLVPLRVRDLDEAALQPSLQQRSPNPTYPRRWQEAEVINRSKLSPLYIPHNC
ncbi:hypothetical protein CRG98_037364 [Punica granatum]|uniref:Glycosyl transferase 48 domain-containing protein n=1 Tax=Punica granatum TaxID=22663 RepID=A0A2I0IE26_PUNGR|nr:hypothetical protein CRG98_037364 [Punica granatum]